MSQLDPDKAEGFAGSRPGFELASTAKELGDVSCRGSHPLRLSFLPGKVGTVLPRPAGMVNVVWWDQESSGTRSCPTLSDCRILMVEQLQTRNCRPESVRDFPKVTQPVHYEARERN